MRPHKLWALLSFTAVILPLAACGGTPSTSSSSSSEGASSVSGSPIDNTQVGDNSIDDNYRAYYQIMPYSYSDSNGDGVGDLKGIIDKIDYIADLNYTGIYLNPVCSAYSYHKYDVMDYYAIDSQFGTLDDFDTLVSTAHAKGLKVLFDLVINHTSNRHPWFKAASQAALAGETDNQYYKYYNFSSTYPGSGWHVLTGSNPAIYFEGQFYDGMPDLNLQSVLDDPTCELGNELSNIMAFWITSHKVDGFRLDAVTSYFTGNITKNTAFLTWINSTCKALNKDFYIVGEGSWADNATENTTYQTSGVDSFFNFANRTTVGPVGASITKANVSKLETFMRKSWSVAGTSGIPANFIGNHDVGRLVGACGGRSNLERAKLGHAFLQLLPGASYNYYGDEIGMAVPLNKAGDPDLRLHMNWGDSHVCSDPPGACAYQEATTYPYPSAALQLQDDTSLLSYVKKINFLRKQFPEIARGSSELLDNVTNSDATLSVGVIRFTYKEKSIVLVIDPSNQETAFYDFGKLGKLSPLAEVACHGNSTVSGTGLNLEIGGIVVLG